MISYYQSIAALLVGHFILSTHLSQSSSKQVRDLKLPPQETSVASPAIFFAPQTQQQQVARSAQRHQTTTTEDLQEPANVPQMLSQEDARLFEQYLRDYSRASPSDRLNLASINDRTPPGHPHQASLPVWPSSNQQVPPRSDQSLVVPAARRYDTERLVSPRKAKVDNVVLFNTQNDIKGKLIDHKMGLRNLIEGGLSTNCIERSTRHISRCEDHLIRRLSQDVTEGRTVVDVNRRLCCALFWHKDCIRSVVIEVCPDSNPPAADILHGPRKLDLSQVCKQITRDSCNGAQVGVRVSPLFVVSLVSLVVVAISSSRQIVVQ